MSEGLSEHHKDVKIAWLLRENQQLREQLLDCQIAAGAISLQEKTEDTESA